jgi:protein TonB
MAVQRGIEGTVMLRIHVDAGGKPIEVSIEKSSGSRILDEAALKVRQGALAFRARAEQRPGGRCLGAGADRVRAGLKAR